MLTIKKKELKNFKSFFIKENKELKKFIYS
jgi:hypothetical protein